MKSLFNKYEAYNEIGGQVSDEARSVLDPIFKKWASEGYRVKDIESIITDNVITLSAIIRSCRAIKMRKKELDKNQ